MSSRAIELPQNREPWLIPLRERISLVYKAKQLKKKICLMVYHHADTSTFRYRCYAHCIRSGENGFLCQPGEWYNILKKVYSEKELVEKTRLQAEKDSLSQYSGDTVIQEIEAAFDRFIQ